MLLPNVERSYVTIYNKHGDTYNRTVIPNAIWKKSLKASFKSQGVLPLDTVKVYIEDYAGYVPYEDYSGLGGWTVTTGTGNNSTYMVRGICPFIFTPSSERGLEEQVRRFEREINYRRPKVVKENFYGSRRINHLMIIC